MSDIQQFLTDLVQAAGITEPTLLKDAVEELEPHLYDRIFVTLLASLPEAEQKKAQPYIDKEKRDVLLTFFEETIPDFENRITAIIEDFADEYLEEMGVQP